MTKIFIDGSAGTTGLRIYERIGTRPDLELIRLPEELRKDPAARKEALTASDIAFLCLPDAAAIEAVALAEGSNTKIIDTSTAHRCAPGWVYGFPEIGGRRELIANASRIANPGCHASGFIALVAPLVAAGMIDADTVLSCFSLTGYSGGGKSMIADYENPDRAVLLGARHDERSSVLPDRRRLLRRHGSDRPAGKVPAQRNNRRHPRTVPRSICMRSGTLLRGCG